jgi:ankyrin repeat protein
MRDHRPQKGRGLFLILILSLTAACATALDKAVLQGDTGQVRALASQAKDEIDKLKPIGSITSGGSLQTVLMVASGRGNKDVVLALLDAGAQVNLRNESGWTALLAAAAYGHVEIQEILLDHGADPKAKFWNGNTPLVYAIRQGPPVGLIERYLEAGADVNAVSVGVRPDLEKSYEGTTALLEAIMVKKPEIVDLLIRKGADVNRADRRSQTPLHAAVVTEQDEIVLRLIREGAVAQILEETGLPLYIAAKIHRVTGDHRASIGATESAVENYLRAAALFEKARPLLSQESIVFGKEMKATRNAELMSALSAGSYLLAVAIGALTPYEQIAYKPTEYRPATTSAQYAALQKKYAELSEGCPAKAAECRDAVEKLKRRRP